jgi:hypothetical protein
MMTNIVSSCHINNSNNKNINTRMFRAAKNTHTR